MLEHSDRYDVELLVSGGGNIQEFFGLNVVWPSNGRSPIC